MNEKLSLTQSDLTWQTPLSSFCAVLSLNIINSNVFQKIKQKNQIVYLHLHYSIIISRTTMREFVAIILYLCLCGQAFGKLVFQIEPKTTDCFGVDARAGDRLKLTFFVLRGGLLDIDLRVSLFTCLFFRHMYSPLHTRVQC